MMKLRARSFIRTLLCLTAMVPLCGCVLVWGKAYHVEFASSTSVTIEFDPAFTDIGYVQNVAQASCAEYGRDAVPDFVTRGMSGLTDATYWCRDR
jgi:hypothetical protein